MKTLIFLSLILIVLFYKVAALDFSYHKYQNLTTILQNYSQYYTQLSPKLYSIGRSREERELWVLKLTAVNENIPAIPNVKLIGNIHGNEAVGRELLLHLIEYLGKNYGKDPDVTWIMNNTRIHILPSMNPDGFEKAGEGICIGEDGRCNVRNMDLNRNFPDFYFENILPTQPESAAVQKWMKQIPFILSASLHGGALVANYPFDTVKEYKWEKLFRELSKINNTEDQGALRYDYIASLPVNPPSISADDDVFRYLAKVYANRHPEMHLGLPCPKGGKNFTGGITNGAAWYPFRGGMQDFNYFEHGCMELTLEISCCKYPQAKELPQLWEHNKYALIDFIKQSHRGVRGVIFDNDDKKPIVGASLKIIGREMYFNTSKDGEFWRILLPGNYKLQVNATGYHSDTVPLEVLPDENKKPKPTILNLVMYKLSSAKPTTTTTTVKPTTLFPRIFHTSTHFVSHPVENDRRPDFDEDARNLLLHEKPMPLESTTRNNGPIRTTPTLVLIVIFSLWFYV